MKAIGGGIASSIFALCLASTGTLRLEGGSLGGYHAVWTICALSGLAAAAVLLGTTKTSRQLVSSESGDPTRLPVGSRHHGS